MKIKGPFTVYLLHFAHAVNPAHYVGITTPSRLSHRMREHAAGRGAELTAAACALGLTWSLAATWETEDRSLEKKIGGLRPLSGVCPICRGQPPIRNYVPTKMAGTSPFRPQAFEDHLALSVTSTDAPPVTKKGKKLRLPPLFLHFGQT